MPKWLIDAFLDALLATVLTVFLTVSFMWVTDAPAWAGSMMFFIMYQIILVRVDLDNLRKGH